MVEYFFVSGSMAMPLPATGAGWFTLCPGVILGDLSRLTVGGFVMLRAEKVPVSHYADVVLCVIEQQAVPAGPGD
jgi:hypothetical protein